MTLFFITDKRPMGVQIHHTMILYIDKSKRLSDHSILHLIGRL